MKPSQTQKSVEDLKEEAYKSVRTARLVKLVLIIVFVFFFTIIGFLIKYNKANINTTSNNVHSQNNFKSPLQEHSDSEQHAKERQAELEKIKSDFDISTQKFYDYELKKLIEDLAKERIDRSLRVKPPTVEPRYSEAMLDID